MYCAAMSIPETVVRECWCTLEELFTGTVRREGVVVHVIDVETGVPSKDSKVFVVKICPGWRAGREIRFGALGTNNLQSVTFVVRELPHPFFARAPGPDNPDVKVWCALTPSQHQLGAIISIPSLSGRDLRLSVKPNSAVVAKRGTKTMKGEGFYVVPVPVPGGGYGVRGDMIVQFRVMSSIEAWLKRGNRMWYAKVIGYGVGVIGALWLGLNALVWALDVDLADWMDVPDALLLSEFPGSYGLFRRVKLWYPTCSIPAGLVADWAPKGLGEHAKNMGYSFTAPPPRGRARF